MKDSSHILKHPTMVIDFGGFNTEELTAKLLRSGIGINVFAQTLFESDHFITSDEKQSISVIEVALKDIGLHNGATLSEIHSCIKDFGLQECTLEHGPYIRLKYQSQKQVFIEGNVLENQSPPGAVTIFSLPPTPDDDFPKGFYLRNIDGVLWLRGYRCSTDYIWSPDDCFIFRSA